MRISRPLRDWSSWPIVPSTGSALYLCSHPVQLVCAEPCWAIIQAVPAGLHATNSCRSSGAAGEECTSYRTAMIQLSRCVPACRLESLENLETRASHSNYFTTTSAPANLRKYSPHFG